MKTQENILHTREILILPLVLIPKKGVIWQENQGKLGAFILVISSAKQSLGR